jgi:hypothetical protein
VYGDGGVGVGGCLLVYTISLKNNIKPITNGRKKTSNTEGRGFKRKTTNLTRFLYCCYVAITNIFHTIKRKTGSLKRKEK